MLLGLWYWLKDENKDLYSNRVSICNGCDSNKRFTCGDCGCFKQLKLRLEDENCPLDKW